MLERVAKHEADVVMVWKVDRFSRFKPMEAIVILYYITDQFQTDFVSLLEPDASTINNPLPELFRLPLLALHLAYAAMEREAISKRTKAGIAAKKAAGQWHGGRPVGVVETKDRKVSIRQDVGVEDMFKPVI
jgi:DNA invertase Pin-like site-specific DNA recombinase